MKDHNAITPIAVVPSVPEGDEIAFLCPDEKLIINKETSATVWKIIGNANGYNTIEEIAKLCELNYEYVSRIIDDLLSLKIMYDSRELYKHFHEISASPDTFMRFLSSQEILNYTNSPHKNKKYGKRIDFSVNNKSELLKLIEGRKSCRCFTDEMLNKDIIGNICYHAYSIRRHTVPSGGGLYPLRLYILVESDQNDMKKGYYEYDSENDELILFSEMVDIETLKYCFNDEDMPFGSAIQLVIAADLERQPYKYSNKGYRLTLIEAGHVAQNVCLYCEQEGLSTCELGGVLEKPLMKELGLSDITPLIAIAIGKEGETSHNDQLNLLNGLIEQYVGEDKPIISYGVNKWHDQNSAFAAYCVLAHERGYSGATASSYNKAVLKAIVEGVERYESGIIRTDYKGRAIELESKWLDPRAICPLSEEQIKQGNIEVFNEEKVISWTEGIKYKTNEKIMIPSDLIYYTNDCIEKRLCYTDSSGVAAHTDYQSAIKNATLELIERDAIMRNWYDKIPPAHIDDSDLPICIRKRKAEIEKKGWRVYALLMESPYVPTFQMVIVGDKIPFFVSGAAASVDGCEEALIKAFEEAEYSFYASYNKRTDPIINKEEITSPEEHGRYYSASNHNNLIDWLWASKEKASLPEVMPVYEEVLESLDPIIVNISYNKLIKVVRVFSLKILPISFGYMMDYFTHNEARGRINTKSQHLVPHYFA